MGGMLREEQARPRRPEVPSIVLASGFRARWRRASSSALGAFWISWGSARQPTLRDSEGRGHLPFSPPAATLHDFYD
jgi:hypothetical protein